MGESCNSIFRLSGFQAFDFALILTSEKASIKWHSIFGGSQINVLCFQEYIINSFQTMNIQKAFAHKPIKPLSAYQRFISSKLKSKSGVDKKVLMNRAIQAWKHLSKEDRKRRSNRFKAEMREYEHERQMWLKEFGISEDDARNFEKEQEEKIKKEHNAQKMKNQSKAQSIINKIVEQKIYNKISIQPELNELPKEISRKVVNKQYKIQKTKPVDHNELFDQKRQNERTHCEGYRQKKHPTRHGEGLKEDQLIKIRKAMNYQPVKPMSLFFNFDIPGAMKLNKSSACSWSELTLRERNQLKDIYQNQAQIYDYQRKQWLYSFGISEEDVRKFNQFMIEQEQKAETSLKNVAKAMQQRPKKPFSPFMKFCKAGMKRISNIPMDRSRKIMVEAWRNLSSEEKSELQQEHLAEIIIYLTKIQIWLKQFNITQEDIKKYKQQQRLRSDSQNSNEILRSKAKCSAKETVPNLEDKVKIEEKL